MLLNLLLIGSLSSILTSVLRSRLNLRWNTCFTCRSIKYFIDIKTVYWITIEMMLSTAHFCMLCVTYTSTIILTSSVISCINLHICRFWYKADNILCSIHCNIKLNKLLIINKIVIFYNSFKNFYTQLIKTFIY